MIPAAAQDSPRLSSRTRDLHASPIREILAVVDRPGMISFAGGLPAADSFPQFSLDAMPQQALQYGASEGDMALRQRIAEDLRERGLACGAEQVLVLSGSQQGIDLVAKLFIDPGTAVAVESPTYLAALQVFRFFGARFVAYDAQAPDAGVLRREQAAFAYAAPTFQNPSGRCLDAAGREALAAACDAVRLPLFEDDPYRDLAYDPCERTPVCARLQRAPWIYQGSFSWWNATAVAAMRSRQPWTGTSAGSPPGKRRPAACSSGSPSNGRSIPANCCLWPLKRTWPSCQAKPSSRRKSPPAASCASISAMPARPRPSRGWKDYRRWCADSTDQQFARTAAEARKVELQGWFGIGAPLLCFAAGPRRASRRRAGADFCNSTRA